ncbi:unnamed protein product [Pleuronectes platessa]|uniref:Uncharacterized protein n=1 Tax=Pleuronectes platessa TaxID=8262 RepID=A0A9N7Z7I9_PLEPL|nr:unnamed protein product [Pleuronectes platessa]
MTRRRNDRFTALAAAAHATLSPGGVSALQFNREWMGARGWRCAYASLRRRSASGVNPAPAVSDRKRYTGVRSGIAKPPFPSHARATTASCYHR